ncbi:MAG TPA: bifunctional [glutamate--ammonia ligase]-adenylyl-L-tyrosine phosphorylase/[glutamate--ammonia-ligase] adenylyltransferase [Sandaracinaceae bacterium LLY-WYZ-13_1]|nr:bifunctional [glutamate--ammonia ligase]-adenylyl-L-tyrosine phosphorylase/[glutamate--ammonia-ligase] adenylyltransferase [Sandaracinaceae bacterium LLY-WYZ-13_1]
MPPADRTSPAARDALEMFRERGGDATDAAQAEAVALLADHAPALLQLVRADPSVIADALARPIEHASDRATLAAELDERLAQGDDLYRALRRFRHRAVVRIALREIHRVADVEQTSAEMAWLAAVVIDAALQASLRHRTARHGPARDADGRDVPLTVLGMGKLGGLELNLGSDVDLVCFYATDEAEVGDGEQTVHELYSRVVRDTTRALSEVTADGFCFRVDLRLRPEGSRGPLVNSLASAERYYESWGRTWERAALLRARPVAGDRAFGAQLLETLRPFVYRRAVDPTIAEQMNEMLLRSRRELTVDEERDVKLGRGGIREAEFFVQTLQLVWGGRHPELQTPGTLDALARLRAAGLVSDREAETLADGWALLRRIEHRIHVWAGYQTHQLPAPGEELERFAASLGYPDADALEAALERVRAGIAGLFGTLLPGGEDDDRRQWDPVCDRVAAGADPDEVAEELAQRLPVREPYESATHLLRLGRRANDPLGPVTWERLPALGRLLLSEVAGAADPDAALRFLADFSTRLGGRWPYERLLLEQPRLTRRLVGLFGASGTLSSALVGHPEDVDLLISSAAPTPSEIAAPHDALRDELAEDPDPEALVAELRRLKRAYTLRIGLAYVARELHLTEASERLSELAEGQVRVSLEAARRWAARRWGRPTSGMVVCAMGKLGGRELGFGGDLDLVFLYGVDGETEPTASGRTSTHAEVFARMAQRTMMFLRQRDAEGPGYETDTRLRPSGSKGTLVVSLNAFDRYHERRAAAWERQALIRARPLAGDPEVAEAAAARFTRLAYLEGATAPHELAHTRGRLQGELAGESAGRYHPKLGFGGLIDVEFLVQWLQMRHGRNEAVRTPSTAAAIDALRDAGHLRPVDAEALAAAYRFLRAVEQSLKLFEEHREPLLEPRGRTGSHVARGLGVRARDGMSPADVLERTYRHHAETVRALFERKVAAVEAPAPWEASA